ncbi:hypothetical protein PV721_13185 [Streptomyces sp. MB09-01]|uniref:hypothetical protein n=1 Tax=Streptomyces sp. MB09-01 TaxID=3028666 RepID=UPI0029AAA532|nr:hypothetical protein [Streptomyces sp. MB09-01]MDX3535313.1 hypothetical protein [Streptomyces sp. MB09-01]
MSSKAYRSGAGGAGGRSRAAGTAGGALNTARQLGTALGIAVLGAVFHAGLRSGLGEGGRDLAGPLASGGAGQLLAGAPAGAARETLTGLVDAAFASGLRETFLASAAMGLAGALAVFLLLRGGAPAAAARIPRARTKSAADAASASPARN